MVSAHASPLSRAADPHIAGLSAELCRRGHEVTVYHRRDDPSLPERVRADAGYDVVHVPAGPRTRLADEDVLPHMGDFTSFLLHEWGESPPDVVHGHRWMSGLVSVLGGRRIRVPVVQTFHSLALGETRRSAAGTGPAERGKIEALVGKEATHVVATSAGEAFTLVKAGVARSRISIVGSGVDLSLFTPEGSRARRGRPYRVVLARPLPAHHTLDAIFTAVSRVDAAELVVTRVPESGRADDPCFATLRARAEEFGVGSKVVFAGTVVRDAVPALLRSADAVVCAPAYDPSGVVALEAMACGVPVVAISAGELADVVVDGVTGLLVPPDDPEALARALHRLLLNSTLREGFAMASRDRVTVRYSWRRVAREVLKVYERAGAGAAKTAAMAPDPLR